MSISTFWILILLVVGMPVQGNAFFCVGPSVFARFKQSEQVFVAEFKRAEYRSDSSDARWPGTVFAEFDVLEVLKGDPSQVSHLEYRIDRPGEQWGIDVALGRPMILFSKGDGLVSTDECFIYGMETGHCTLYQVRKMANVAVEPDPDCDIAMLRYRFRLKGVTPEAPDNDYQALRQEWFDRFGEWPESFAN